MESTGGLLVEPNPMILSAYVFYTVLLCIKLLSNIPLTVAARMKTGIPPNPEDGKTSSNFKKPATATHPDLVRVHRMHMNDLENIIPFLFMTFVLCMAYTDYTRVIWHFRIFFGARVLHSICHYFAIQPFRSLFWMIALITNFSVAGHILCKVGLTADYF